MSEKTSFWEVVYSRVEGGEVCTRKPIARFERAVHAQDLVKMLNSKMAVSAHWYENYEVQMVQRVRL